MEHPKTKANQTRSKARAILAAGAANPSELAAMAGVSRQLMRYWARGINWRKARAAWLMSHWISHIGEGV